MDMEARIRRLEDRAEIQNLHARYANAVDDRDLDVVADCFCEDGVFGRWGTDDRAEGREAVVQFYRDRLGGTGPSFHYPHVAEIVFDDDDNAHGTLTAHAEMSVDGRLMIAGLRYMDRYRRDPDGRWRFAERYSRFYYFMPHDELDTNYGARDRITWPAPARPADLPDGLDTWKAFVGGDA
jgi:uncharacterized protein (TIGR02246 family)